MELPLPRTFSPAVPAHERRRLRRTWTARLVSHNRYVLGIALALAWVIPEAFHSLLEPYGYWFARVYPGILKPPLLVVILAVCLGHASLSRLGVLPLVATRSLIIPTFIVSFGACSLLFVTVGIPIGRYHIWTGFLMAVGWYWLVARLRARHLRPRIALAGQADDLAARLGPGVELLSLTRPALPRGVSAVVIEPRLQQEAKWSKFITRLVLDGVPVYHRGQFEESLTGRVKFGDAADNDLGALLPSLLYLRIKRVVDVIGALLLMPVFLPVIAFFALLIRIESPGSPIFRQIRIGHRARPFVCYKLRTMRAGATGPQYTLEGDPRITRLGALLRKWRIDELPQIFNVLAGQMSWIGPRPEAYSLARLYASKVPFYHYRHAVRPGITGWAAVHQGNVGDVDAAQVKLEYDFYYIRHFSPALDFLILLKTIRTVRSGFGSR